MPAGIDADDPEFRARIGITQKASYAGVYAAGYRGVGIELLNDDPTQLCRSIADRGIRGCPDPSYRTLGILCRRAEGNGSERPHKKAPFPARPGMLGCPVLEHGA
jgi:hypothetical protein